MRFFVPLFLTVSLAAQQPQNPENTARTALISSLNVVAHQQTTARSAKIATLKTVAQVKSRQATVRATMLRLLGPLPERTPLNPQMLGESQLDGFRIQRIVFESQPKFYVTALLYLPESEPGEKLPAIVMAPGHGPAGKASDFAFASTFARNGFAVLSYDPIGQGERLQYPDPADPTKSLATRPTGEHAEASLQPILIGESLGKYMLWDGMRAVDYLQSRPEIDPLRIGAFGCSGGGAMTALLGALDTRVAAVGTACYITSFDTLLASIGPQDGEQSTPGWIAAGLDFPDWVEVAAPRPYAIIATESDMFPFAGAQSTEAEARRFYGILNAGKNLAFLHGPGGHGNLRPIQGEIVRFFLTHLAHSDAEPVLQPTPAQAAQDLSPGRKAAEPSGLGAKAQGFFILTPETLQVTATGQVATAYPGSATVSSLNLAHFKTLPPPHPLDLAKLQAAIRQITGAAAFPGDSNVRLNFVDSLGIGGIENAGTAFESEPGIKLPVYYAHPDAGSDKPIFLTVSRSMPGDVPANPAELADAERQAALAREGKVAIQIAVRPHPVGSEDQKSPILGGFYLLNLRAELVGRTLLGMRIDDIIKTVDALGRVWRSGDVDARNINAQASGHEALVLLHAAVLDGRFKHITLSNLPTSYANIVATALPKDMPEDLIPGVLLHYDIPDLIRALGDRVTITKP